MWNGAPGSSTASAFASASANGSTVVNAPSEVACMCAKSSTGRTQPSRREISTTSSSRAELAHAAHHLDPERHGAILPAEPLAQLAELLADRVDRLLARAAEQEARMEDDELGAGGLRDAGRVVEHADRHVQLLAALGVAHEAGDRRVHREHDVVLARELAEPRPRSRSPSRSGPRSRSRTRCSRASSSGCDRRLGALLRAGTRAGPKCSRRSPSTRSLRRAVRSASSTLVSCPRRPSRIDLLELDIDLRLADLWREAAGIERMVARGRRRVHARGLRQGLLRRAHRGGPGSLCADHGYRVPERRDTAARRRLTRTAAAARPHGRARLSVRAVDGWLDWPRGTLEAQPRAARDRALRRRAARDLPALHGGRRQLDADAAAEQARGPDRHGLAHRQGRRAGHGRRALRRRAPLRAPQHQRRRARDGRRRLPRLRARPVQGRAATSTSTGQLEGGAFVADRADDEVPEQVHRTRTPSVDG